MCIMFGNIESESISPLNYKRHPLHTPITAPLTGSKLLIWYREHFESVCSYAFIMRTKLGNIESKSISPAES